VPKADGAERPIGIPVLEDKMVQGAVAEVLSAIYEVDFLGFSYGFRPGRSPHQALDALNAALIKRKINWVLDADVRRFFDSVDHEWLLRMVAHRIADPRILRLIRQWLRAGVLESGKMRRKPVFWNLAGMQPRGESDGVSDARRRSTFLDLRTIAA